jgi:hypothetical protein
MLVHAYDRPISMLSISTRLHECARLSGGERAPETLEILALASAVRGEEDRFEAHVTLNGPLGESKAVMRCRSLAFARH